MTANPLLPDPVSRDDDLDDDPDGAAPDAADERAITIDDGQSGMRLDRILADAWPDLSRSRLKALIAAGAVSKIGRVVVDPSCRVKPGEIYRLEVPAPEPAEPVPQDIPLDVVFEDAHLIVIDKPPGMVVHPAAGNPDGTLVNALLAHCGGSLSGIGGVRRPGIVHRIDKDTSGLLVVAKTDAAHAGLSALFAAHDLERVYQAVVWGLPSPAADRIEGNIGRAPHDRKRMTVLERGGKPAVTDYAVQAVAPGGAATLLTCRLATGRTHQIRVHLTARGHPLIGDPLYGRSSKARLAALPPGTLDAVRAFSRQALHAAVLGFRHPVTGVDHKFERAPPADMADLIRCLFGAVLLTHS